MGLADCGFAPLCVPGRERRSRRPGGKGYGPLYKAPAYKLAYVTVDEPFVFPECFPDDTQDEWNANSPKSAADDNSS